MDARTITTAAWATMTPKATNPIEAMITSRDNKWLKSFRAALRGHHADVRPQNGRARAGSHSGELLGIEGPKLVEEALRAGLEAEALLVSESGEREAQRILQAASESESGIPQSRVFRTSDKLFAGVAGTESPQGVAALFRQREYGFEDILRGAGGVKQSSPLVIVLAAVQDPGNVGTILRSAEAFGATGAAAARGTADPWSPKALRASAGSALRLPVMRGIAVPVLLAQLRVSGIKIYGATSQVSTAGGGLAPKTREADLTEACAIFVGNEGAGLPPEVEHAADALISIPTSAVESLNAGVAASIVLYEAARQRRRQSQSGS
jgi:RNA methyltransferase, TrmH family